MSNVNDSGRLDDGIFETKRAVRAAEIQLFKFGFGGLSSLTRSGTIVSL